MSDKYQIINDKKQENLDLEKQIIDIEENCDKCFVLQENIDEYFKLKLPLLKYNITKLEDFLIEIATIKCIVIDENSVLLLNKFNENFTTKVDLIGLFNQIRGIRVSTKYGINKDSIKLFKKYYNYLNKQEKSFDNLKELINSKYINLDKSKYRKLHKHLNEIIKFSRILIEDIHLNILIEKLFNLLEQKEDIIKLNKKYINLLSNSNNEYDIELYNKIYEKDLNKVKKKKR